VLLVGLAPRGRHAPEPVEPSLVTRGVLQATPHGWTLAPSDAPLAALLAGGLSPRAGARRFTELLDSAARELSRLGLDRPPSRPAVSRWASALVHLPTATDPALAALLHRVATVLDALELALADDGAAVTAGEARARSAGLLGLHGDLVDLVTSVAVGASIAAPSLRP
jgi:hypothetical protein